MADEPSFGSKVPDSARREEEFLFHFYRGTELLSDAAFDEAEDALLAALHLRPEDARTKDLLDSVRKRRHTSLAEKVFEVVAQATSEMDAGSREFSVAESGTGRSDVGAWQAVELGAPSPEQKAPTRAPEAPPHQEDLPVLAFEGPETIEKHPCGVLLVRTRRGFALRLEGLRASAGDFASQVLFRKTLGRDPKEALGGIGSPLLRLEGDLSLMLGSRAEHVLSPVRLHDQVACVREDALFGFSLTLDYRNTRLLVEVPLGAAGDSGIHLVEFSGTGSILLETTRPVVMFPLPPTGRTLARHESLLGWVGDVEANAVPPRDAPAGQRGLLALTGDGHLLVAG